MKTKIKEVQQYFKQKLLAGEFEQITDRIYNTIAIVDGEFEFVFWMGNLQIDGACKTTSDFGKASFIHLDWNQKEAMKMRTFLKSAYLQFENRANKEKLKELKKEIAKLEKM